MDEVWAMIGRVYQIRKKMIPLHILNPTALCYRVANDTGSKGRGRIMVQLPASPRRLTPDKEHWFFGYYDIPAFDAASARHLCLHVPFMDRLPVKDDVASLHVIDVATGAATRFAETTAWNFQQACMLQWHPTLADTVLYNVRTEGVGCGYGAVVHDLSTGVKKALDRPVANVAKTGIHAVSINFDRMYDFRPGYGYAGQRDAFYDQPHPAEDGIFLVDLASGKSRLIVSLAQIWAFAGGYFEADQKICINHITFNTSGTRMVFLVRNFPTPGNAWRTALLTCDTDGGNLFLLSDFAMASHYHWRDEQVVAFYSQGRELGSAGPQLYELTDRTHQGRAIDPAFFVRDGHNSYAPDLEWMLYDSYPLEDGHRELYLYDLVAGRGGLLGRYAVAPCCTGDIRCDLHPVWAPNGRDISFDSVHEGYRALYWMDLSDAMKALRG